MAKNTILISLLCSLYFLPPITHACEQADPTNSVNFCASFKRAAICHCPPIFTDEVCRNMHMLYDNMVEITGSLAEACNMQSDTSPQNCIDDWNCYLKGGKNSKGQLCSGTGKKCE